MGILIIGGGGRTGISLARFLLEEGYTVYALEEDPQKKPPFKRDRYFWLSSFPLHLWERIDRVTYSPGVPLSHSLIKEAKKRKIPVYSEIELVYPLLQDSFWIGITGTDGKSTTTSLLTHLLNFFSLPATSCGNWGVPFSSLALKKKKEKKTFPYLVAELSSYQLEKIGSIRFPLGILLNISEDHLDRYSSLEEYALSKWNLIKNMQKEDTLILSEDLLPFYGKRKLWRDISSHPLLQFYREKKYLPRIKSVSSLSFSSSHFLWRKEGASWVLYKKEKGKLLPVIKEEELSSWGVSFRKNVLFALEGLLSLGVSFSLEDLGRALSLFSPLEHRMEKISREGDPNLYINDSKATTTQAVIHALSSIEGEDPIFLFLGGKPKGEDYTKLIPYIKRKKYVVLFLFSFLGEELIPSLQNERMPFFYAKTLEEAFFLAKEYQKREGIKRAVYLLSPGGTSWDFYKNFEERGEHFKELIFKA